MKQIRQRLNLLILALELKASQPEERDEVKHLKDELEKHKIEKEEMQLNYNKQIVELKAEVDVLSSRMLVVRFCC